MSEMPPAMPRRPAARTLLRWLVALYLVALHLLVGLMLWKTNFSEIVAKNVLGRLHGIDAPYVGAPRVVIGLDLPARSGRAGGLIVADLDGDGAPEFVVTKPGHIAVSDGSGRRLWARRIDIRLSDKAERDGLPGQHAPGVQAGDIDGDGTLELLFLTGDGGLHIVDGASGRLRQRIELAAPPGADGWQHLVLADFRGAGERELLLQTSNAAGRRHGRYLAAYALDALMNDAAAPALWTRDDFRSAEHGGARLADLDGDGRDEVLGGMILGPDGRLLVKFPNRGHIDAIHVADVRPDLPGLEVVALEEGGGKDGNRIFLAGRDGLVWQADFQHSEPQNTAIGEFDPARPGLEIWCRSRFNYDQRPFVFDAAGALITGYRLNRIAPADWTIEGVEVIATIDWTGGPRQLVAAKERHESGDVVIFDPLTGRFLHRFAERADRLYVADVLGDWREELIVLNGNELHVYANPEPEAGPERPRLWLRRDYRRSKMTWNYYNT